MILFILLYVVPVIIMYFYFSTLFYHPKGKFKGLHPVGIEYFLMLMPVINLFGVFYCWLFWYPIERKLKHNYKKPFIQKFFSYPFKKSSP